MCGTHIILLQPASRTAASMLCIWPVRKMHIMYSYVQQVRTGLSQKCWIRSVLTGCGRKTTIECLGVTYHAHHYSGSVCGFAVQEIRGRKFPMLQQSGARIRNGRLRDTGLLWGLLTCDHLCCWRTGSLLPDYNPLHHTEHASGAHDIHTHTNRAESKAFAKYLSLHWGSTYVTAKDMKHPAAMNCFQFSILPGCSFFF